MPYSAHCYFFVYNENVLFHRFESNIDDDDITHVSHNVTNFEFLYEPFYVSLDSGILI